MAQGGVAGEAVAVIRGLSGPMGPADVDRLAGIARSLFRSRPGLEEAFHFASGMPPEKARSMLVQALAPFLLERMLPELRDRIVAGLSGDRAAQGGDGGPQVVVCADALRKACDLLSRSGGARGAGAFPSSVGRAAAGLAESCLADLGGLIEREDFPDLDKLSYDLLRLESLRTVVEIVGDPAARESIAYQSRRLARLTLKRATATIEAFLKARDLMSLFDNAAVVSQVDNLIVVVARLLDAQEAREEESTAFVETADQQALAAYIGALERLSGVLYGIVLKAIGRAETSDHFFAGTARQLEYLYEFASRLDHKCRPPELDGVEERIHDHLRALIRRLAEALEANMKGGDARALRATLAHAETLVETLDRMGLHGDATPLLGLIRRKRRADGA